MIARATPHAPPYLSVVVTARNDNHGGDLLTRMQLFIDGFREQCERYNLPAELILVEWNPPQDQPPLAEALRWDRHPGVCSVRIVRVPPEVHSRFKFADKLPLFQMIAKNAGIRRAAGQFVLATNIDILFSNELIQHLAKRTLRGDRMYRVDRHDADPKLPQGTPVDQCLAACGGSTVRVNGRVGSTDARTGDLHRIYWDLTPRVWLLERLQDARLVPTVTRKRLHLNACGDFTLLSREKCFALRGYPELEIFSMHLDSLFCTAAHFGGARECVLPASRGMKIFHLEHAIGSGWSPEGEAKLNERLAQRGIEQLRHEQFHAWAVKMRRERKAMVFNGEDWGLVKEGLEEVRV